MTWCARSSPGASRPIGQKFAAALTENEKASRKTLKAEGAP